jgi:hypothetical protein
MKALVVNAVGGPLDFGDVDIAELRRLGRATLIRCSPFAILRTHGRARVGGNPINDSKSTRRKEKCYEHRPIH